MAITFLKAVNRTLVKLRENETTDLSSASDYEKLIAAFVNESKEEVENAWKWNVLTDEESVTTASGTSQYVLTGWGDEYSIEAVFNSSNNYWLKGPMQNWRINQWIEITDNTSSPTWWDIYMADGTDPYIRFWPIPDSVYTIKVWGWHQQAYLETSSDNTTVIKVPWKPVVFGAYAKALSERGEDGGVVYDEAVRAYDNALSDAVALDAATYHSSVDWHNEDSPRTKTNLGLS